MDPSNQLVETAKNYRQWYLEDRPTASAYAYAMLDPEVLVPVLTLFYTRLLRNRTYYLRVEDVEWGRTQALYKWIQNYFDTTDPQTPGATTLSNQPLPLTSVAAGKEHLLHTFNREFGLVDTYHVREKRRLDTFAAMNGEDDDCYWSYMGPTGGAHLRPLVLKDTGPDGVAMDAQSEQYLYNRKFNQNPAALYGQLYRAEEAAANERAGTHRSLYRSVDVTQMAQ